MVTSIHCDTQQQSIASIVSASTCSVPFIIIDQQVLAHWMKTMLTSFRGQDRNPPQQHFVTTWAQRYQLEESSFRNETIKLLSNNPQATAEYILYANRWYPVNKRNVLKWFKHLQKLYTMSIRLLNVSKKMFVQ